MRKINLENFIFFTDPPWDERKVFRTLIPITVEDKDQLFKYYASLLQIGGYFGHNWDAMDEVLKDLEWIEERDIEILHEGLPTITNKEDLRSYLSLLSEAVDFWKGEGISGEYMKDRTYPHKLNIYFPEKSKEEISKLAAQL